MDQDSLFPKYNLSRQKGEKGVTRIKSIVEDDFNWIFRVNHQEHDFGIDGYIDLVSIKGQITGKSIAVQIKYGKSFFAAKNDIGWIFRGEKKHLNYFMNIDIPVFICIVNPETNIVYWELFQLENTNKAGENWTLTIPFQNTLSIQNKTKIHNCVGDVTDYISQLENFWELNKEIENSGLILIIIEKIDIENLNVEGFINLFNWFESNINFITLMRNKVNFLVKGYDDDSREIYQIPEVRDWIKILFPEINSWGYFLNMEETLNGLSTLQYCLGKIETFKERNNKPGLILEPDSLEELVNALFLGLNTFCEKHNINEKIVYEQSQKIIKCLTDGQIKID